MNSPLRRVLVPLDGSPASQRALAIGVAIARREGAVLHLVTVVGPIVTLSTEAGSPAHDYTIDQAVHEGFRRYLDQHAEEVRRLDPGLEVVCGVLDGLVAEELARYARQEDIDLIVMTTHGWGGLRRVWLGSVAQELVHRVHCPTLLMRPGAEAPSFGPHRILVALERPADADVLLEPALALGTLAQGARYTLLQVVQLRPSLLLRVAGIPDRTVRDWVAEVAEQAAGRLEQAASRFRHRGIAVDARVLVERRAGEQILGFARRSGADLIVMGTRASGLERAVFGSVADKVVRGATQLVLVVPTRAEAIGTAGEDREAMEPARAAAVH